MTDAPTPYAPGIITDERVPARPPGRPVVFLVAAFALGVAGNGPLWQYWSVQSMLDLGASRTWSATVQLVGAVPSILALLWAYLSDVAPVWGTRREGYLVITSLMMAIGWLAMLAVGDHLVSWVALSVLFGLAVAASRAATLGALAEIGRRRAITGPLAAVSFGVGELGLLAGGGLLTALEPLDRGWSAGVGAGVALAVVVLVATMLDDSASAPAIEPPAAPAERVSIPSFLRSRTFWASFAVLVCAGAATVPREFLNIRLRFLQRGELETIGQQWVQPVIAIAVAGVYALACRYVRFRIRFGLALLAEAVALALPASGGVGFALLLRTAGDSLSTVGVLDLALRAAPRGREAFGAVLLAGIPVVIRFGGMPALMPFLIDPSVVLLALVGAALAVLAACLVSLLPRDLD
jgi:MFS family permease